MALTATQARQLHAEVVGINDDPYVLVRGITDTTTDADIDDAAMTAWTGPHAPGHDVPATDLPNSWKKRPPRLYRWIPDPHGSEYSRYLHFADQPGPGAFVAVEAYPSLDTGVLPGAPERPDALARRILHDGRELTLYSMTFNLRLCIGAPQLETYDDAWCFHDDAAAMTAITNWDGRGDPAGWAKHVGSQTFNPTHPCTAGRCS